MGAFSICEGVVNNVDLLEAFCYAAVTNLPAILCPTRSPVASAVFWSTLSEEALSSSIYFFVVSRSFSPYLLLSSLSIFFAKNKHP